MSASGHSRPIHSALIPANVRCYSNSDLTLAQLNCPLSANSRQLPSARFDSSVAERLSALALPIEGTYNSLTGKNRAGLFGRSDDQLVALELEESNLVQPGKQFVPRYVHFSNRPVGV